MPLASLSLYSRATLVLWLACFALLAVGAKTANRDIRVAAQGSILSRIFKVGGMLCMFAVIYFPRLFHLPTAAANRSALIGLVGVFVCLAGVSLLMLARRSLGRNWSDLVVLKEGHQLIERGPYRWVRHPLYSGGVLGMLGSALTVGTRAAYAVVAICFVGLLVKSRQEEALLLQQFPEYAGYKRRVKSFIPFVF